MADLGEGPGGSPPPPTLIFGPNPNPNPNPNQTRQPPPYLRVWMILPSPPPPCLIWRSGSASVCDKKKTFKFSRTRKRKKTVRVRGVSELSGSIEKFNLPCQKLVVTDFSALQCMVQCQCTYFIRNGNMFRYFYDRTWSVRFSLLFLSLHVTVPFFP